MLEVIKFSILVVCRHFFPILGCSVSKVFTWSSNIVKCIIYVNLWRTRYYALEIDGKPILKCTAC